MGRPPFDIEGAACEDHPRPDIFFEKEDYREARVWCHVCTARAQCYLTALFEGRVGTWGGVWIDPKVGRRKIRKDLRRVVREARLFLLNEYGILIEASDNVERVIQKTVRRYFA